MLARGHKLAVDGNSMIGWSIANAQARITLQAEADAVRRVTAELPETSSEAALPLRSRGKVLGALTVQSDKPNAFDQDTVTVLQTMADQIAIALENARLLAESQSAVEAMRRAASELSHESWRQIAQVQTISGVHSDPSGVATIPSTRAAPGRSAPNALAIPVKVRGNTIGVIDTFKPVESGQWTPEEIALAETVADQLGAALDSARLYEDTQRRAAQERLTGAITTKMRESLDMERVLNTAADEMYQALGLDRLVIQLAAQTTAPEDTGTGGAVARGK